MLPGVDTNLFYNRCVFTDGKRLSPDFMELARQQPQLTFDERFLGETWALRNIFDQVPRPTPGKDPGKIHSIDATPFKEIWLTKPEEHSPDLKLSAVSPVECAYPEYLQLLRQAYRKVLLKTDPDQKYLQLHSSGVDSRIISGIMAELRREGIRDFDNVHFRCFGEVEVDSFKRLMKQEGWTNWSIQHDTGKDGYDVGRCDMSVDGFYPYTAQCNFWLGLDPKEYTLILGSEGFVFKLPFDKWQRRKGYLGDRGEVLTRQGKIFSGIFLPIMAYEVLELTEAMRPEWRSIADPRLHRDKVRTDLAELVGTLGPPLVTARSRWDLSDARKQEMLDAYYGSKFYRDFKVGDGLDFFVDPVHTYASALWAFAVTVYEKLK